QCPGLCGADDHFADLADGHRLVAFVGDPYLVPRPGLAAATAVLARPVLPGGCDRRADLRLAVTNAHAHAEALLENLDLRNHRPENHAAYRIVGVVISRRRVVKERGQRTHQRECDAVVFPDVIPDVGRAEFVTSDEATAAGQDVVEPGTPGI